MKFLTQTRPLGRESWQRQTWCVFSNAKYFRGNRTTTPSWDRKHTRYLLPGPLSSITMGRFAGRLEGIKIYLVLLFHITTLLSWTLSLTMRLDEIFRGLGRRRCVLCMWNKRDSVDQHVNIPLLYGSISTPMSAWVFYYRTWRCIANPPKLNGSK